MLDHQLPEIDRDELLLLQASVRDSSVTHHIRVSSAIAEHIETELANMTSAVGHIRIDGAIGYTAYLTATRLQNLQSLTFDVEQPPFPIESVAPPAPKRSCTCLMPTQDCQIGPRPCGLQDDPRRLTWGCFTMVTGRRL